MSAADSYQSLKQSLNKHNTGDVSLQDVTLLLAGLYFRETATYGENQISVFNSATTILKSLEDIFVDLQENNGIEWKIFLSELNSQKQLNSQTETRISEASMDLTTRDKKEAMKNELAEIEVLIDKISKSKNRREKRRLLAIYNQHQVKIWGSAPGQQNSTAKIAKYQTDELTLPSNQVEKVWSPYVNGYVDRRSFEDALKT